MLFRHRRQPTTVFILNEIYLFANFKVKTVEKFKLFLVFYITL